MGPDKWLVRIPNDGGTRFVSTITDAMTLAVAVVALHCFDGVCLSLLLRTELGGMSEFVTVGALGDAAIDNLTSIGEPLQILLGALGPDLTLTRTSGLGAETVSDRILLVHVALEIHVGQGGSHIRFLNGDEPDANVLAAEGFLKLKVGGVRARLDVDLNGILDIIELALLGSGDNEVPSGLGSHVGKVTTVDVAGKLATSSTMSCFRDV